MTYIPPMRTPSKTGLGGLRRQVTVTPAMCGGSSSIFAQIGDWTWETVAAASRTDVYNARTADGRPSYLSFYFFHVRGSTSIHPHGLTFGDQLEVTSRSFDFGRESVLTLHRLARSDLSRREPEPLDPEEFFTAPRPDCLYVQNFNRWISRSRLGSNEDLDSSSPVGFAHADLPALPERYSPRGTCSRARKNASFSPGGLPGYRMSETFSTDYRLDVVHDFNGVGLVYFASYFSIIDTALVRLWHELGRDDRQFLARRVLEQKVGYFGNVDVGAHLSIAVRLWTRDADARDEAVEVVVREQSTDRLLAVAEIRMLVEGP